MNDAALNADPGEAKAAVAVAEASAAPDCGLPFGNWLQTVRLADRSNVAERRAQHRRERANKRDGRRQRAR